MTKSEVFEVVQRIIAEQTGNHIEDIIGATHLQDELGILGPDFARVVRTIGEELEVSLSVSDLEDEVETVDDLVAIAFEEAELG